MDSKTRAVMQFVRDNDAESFNWDGYSTLNLDGDEYLVYDDEEASSEAYNEAKRLLWAFKPEFLSPYLGMPAAEIALLSERLCEDAGPIFERMAGDDLDTLINDAIGLDGRGHFLAPHDFEEIEMRVDGNGGPEYFYFYRTD